MKYSTNDHTQTLPYLLRKYRFLLLAALLIIIAIPVIFLSRNSGTDTSVSNQSLTDAKQDSNPLAGKKIYNDQNRPVSQLAAQLRTNNKPDDARAADKIASQPASTWLVGPSSSDPEATRDIDTVIRTSAEATRQGTTPVYVLYAIPRRDACAGLSGGGFSSNEAYLAWIGRVTQSTATPAVFVVEPDSIGHTITAGCLNDDQRMQRYDLIHSAVKSLNSSKKALAIYLDAANPEWITDSNRLVQPLKRAGIDEVRGVAVNVSAFVATPETLDWSKKLLDKLGRDKTAVIDTSRNGNGVPAVSVTGTARWCNPTGRALGTEPSTDVSAEHIDAYLWIKNIGESDGACFGYPSAGTFMPDVAVQLAKAAK